MVAVAYPSWQMSYICAPIFLLANLLGNQWVKEKVSFPTFRNFLKEAHLHPSHLNHSKANPLTPTGEVENTDEPTQPQQIVKGLRL